MERPAKITSGLRLLALLLLTAALLLVVLRIVEPRLLELKDWTDSTHSSVQPQSLPGGFLIVPPSRSGDRFAATGWTVWTVLLATVLALPISIGLMGLYRRAVYKSMRRRTSNAHVEQVLRPNTTAPTTQAIPQFVTINGTGSLALTPAARSIFRKVRLLPWMTAIVYAMAGLGFALMTTLAVLISGHSRISPLRLVTLLWLYAWPAALATNLVAAKSRRTRIAVVSAYFGVYLIIAAIAVSISPQLTRGQILELWVLDNLYPTILLLIFINRRVRAVGPLILLLMIMAVNGAMAAPYLLFSPYMKGLTELALRAMGASHTFTAAQVLGFAALGVAGWYALQYVRRSYEDKKLSDQVIILGAMWLQFAVFWFVNLAFEGYVWILSIVPAFIVYLLASRAGFALMRSFVGAQHRGRRLLVLRVFALGKQSERLFEVVAKSWRHVGSITQIAGPDLATATVQPHEFLDFMSGKLSRRFIDSEETLELRLSETDNIADADGRFRVNDFFCYEDTWKFVLDRLVQDSDAVLMDLRGFSALNAGCVFEIEELVNLVPLGRVVFVIDGTTDEEFLRTTMKQAWRRMCSTSPNRQSQPFHLFRFGNNSGHNLPDLLRALCAAADTAPCAERLQVASLN